jgi:hypothetical protein
MLEVKLISQYLIENNFVSSYDDALGVISCMTDSWMSMILENFDYIMEMRKEDKVRGRKPTPLYVRGRKSIVRDPKTNKLKVHQKLGPNPFAHAKMIDQDMVNPALRNSPHPQDSLTYDTKTVNKRHPHGGAAGTRTNRPGVSRGKKVKKGEPTPPSQERAIDYYNRQRDRIEWANTNLSPSERKERRIPSKVTPRKTPKLNLPSPPPKEKKPTKTVVRKTTMNKFGKAKTASQVLNTLNQL